MQGVSIQPHIQLHKGQVCPVVLTLGDPGRVESVGELCDSYEELSFNREYRSINATVKGQKFTVISHGIGCAGAMICFEELRALGAKVIIRAGTCGSLKPERIKTGDVFVPYAVARDNDVTDLYVPLRMPAVATPRIYQVIMKCAEELGISCHTGIGLSNGVFYGHAPEHMENLQKWGRLTDVVEFEFQGLFLVGAARGIETGGIAAVDGSPLQWDQNNYDPSGAKCKQAKVDMLRIAIESCVRLSKE